MKSSSPDINGNGHSPASGEAQGIDPGLLRVLERSMMQSRADIAQVAGITFGGKRDMHRALGYARALTSTMYRERFERGGVAARLVRAYPRATWGGGVEVYDDEDPTVDTAFEAAVKKAFKRLKVLQVLLRLDILTGLGRYGVLLVTRGQPLNQPLPPNATGKILSLIPMSEEYARVAALDQNLQSERFGLVDKYNVHFQTGVGQQNINGNNEPVLATVAQDVHWSHCIHFVENPLQFEIYGEPRLRAVWNDLDDLDKLKGGGAEAAWRRAHMGMNAKVDPEAVVGWDDAKLKAEIKRVREQLDEYDNHFRRFVQTIGVDLQPLAGSPFDFKSNVESVISIIASTCDIPQRKLMGSGIGEMTGKMEDDSFNDNVTERRNNTAEPLVRDIVDALIASGEVPEPANGEYELAWPEEEELSELEKAQLMEQMARANAYQKQAGGDPFVLSAEVRDRVYGWDPIDPEELDALRESNKPPPPPPGANPLQDPLNPTDPNAPPQASPGAPPPTQKSPPVARSAAARSAAGKARAGGGGRRLQRQLHEFVDREAPHLRGVFEDAIRQVRSSVDMKALEAAVRSGDRSGAERVLMAAAGELGTFLDEKLTKS